MSFFQNAENRINKQFISIFDSVKFISEHGQGTLEQSFTYLDSALLKKQTHLLKVTAYTVKSVYLCSENDYAEIPPFMTIEQVKSELWACVERNSIGDGNPIFNLGFAKKRFFEQLKNTGFPISDDLLLDTLSPDFDDTNLDDSDSFAFYQSLPNEYQTLQRSYDELKARYDDLYSGGKGLAYVYFDKIDRMFYERLKEKEAQFEKESDENTRLSLALNEANKRIDRLIQEKIALEKAKKDLGRLLQNHIQAEKDTNNTYEQDNFEKLSFFDWQSMDKHTYPPELHLAMQLWQAYYEYDFPKNVTEFSDRLSIVARQLGIATSGNLYDRLKTLLNPLNQKQSSPALLDILKAIPAIDTDKLDN